MRSQASYRLHKPTGQAIVNEFSPPETQGGALAHDRHGLGEVHHQLAGQAGGENPLLGVENELVHGSVPASLREVKGLEADRATLRR